MYVRAKYAVTLFLVLTGNCMVKMIAYASICSDIFQFFLGLGKFHNA